MRVAVCLLLVAASVCAQRDEVTVEWQKQKAAIEYGVVPVGRHKLDALAVGGVWRMGRNEPSKLRADMPLLVGEQVIVPGSYRVQVARPGESELALAIDGGSVGDVPDGAPASVYAKGELAKPSQPSKALRVAFKLDGKKSSDPVQGAKVTVTFGENEFAAPMQVVGTKAAKAGAWTVLGFSLPRAFVEKRIEDGKRTPVASIRKPPVDRKDPPRLYNLFVGKDSAALFEAPVAPADVNTRIAGANAPTAATEVKWEDATSEKQNAEITKAEFPKGKPGTIVLHVGKKICTITIAEPKS